MGWCSGTDVFDPVVKYVLEKSSMSQKQQIEIIGVLIETLQHADWDCESDSDYWKHPVVRKAFKKTCPDWDWKDIEEYE